MILSSKRVRCPGISCDAKRPWRARDTSIVTLAGVAGDVDDQRVLAAAPSIQRLLGQELGQLLEQVVLTDQVPGLAIVGQQSGQQFIGPRQGCPCSSCLHGLAVLS